MSCHPLLKPTLPIALTMLFAASTANAGSRTTLVDRINAIPDLSVLGLALEVSGLDTVFDVGPSLDKPIPRRYSIYGPTNQAFDGVAEALGCADSLELANGLVATGLLTPVLEIHASIGRNSVSAILDDGSVDTLSNTFPPLMSGISGTGVYLAANGNDPSAPPEIVFSDRQAVNGILHIINGVLLPVAPEVVDQALAAEGYCT